MRDVIHEINSWRGQGKPVAIAANVRRDGTSMRPLGSKMAVTDSLDIAGSLTGGCIENAVYEEAQSVLKSGVPKLLRYGVVNEERPWEIGLICGSSLEVFVESLDSPQWRAIYPALQACLAERRPVAVATIIAGSGVGNKALIPMEGERVGSLGHAALDAEVAAWAKNQLRAGESGSREFEAESVFVDVLLPPPHLIVIGAVHIAIPLVELARTLGFYTIVIDPREALATRERFSRADELTTDWPAAALETMSLDDNSYVAVLSHDEKIDNPALKIALSSRARYVGVLGAKKNVDKRLNVLREMGATEKELQRLRAPIGLPLGAVSPEEIALAILAEIIAARHERMETLLLR